MLTEVFLFERAQKSFCLFANQEQLALEGLLVESNQEQLDLERLLVESNQEQLALERLHVESNQEQLALERLHVESNQEQLALERLPHVVMLRPAFLWSLVILYEICLPPLVSAGSLRCPLVALVFDY